MPPLLMHCRTKTQPCSDINASASRGSGSTWRRLSGSVPATFLLKSKSKTHEESHFQIRRNLDKKPRLSKGQLVERVGISLRATNYFVNALKERGFVRVQTFQRCPRKLCCVYALTPKWLAEKTIPTTHRQKPKMAEYGVLTSEIESVKKEHQVMRQTLNSGLI